MNQNALIINSHSCRFKAGDTILDVARRHNIDIPTLCHLKGCTPTGACRICIVELEGKDDLVTSCTTPAQVGMVVRTESAKVIAYRKQIIAFMLSSGNHNCTIGSSKNESWTAFQMAALDKEQTNDLCPAWGNCELQNLAYQYQVKGSKQPQEELKPDISVAKRNPLILRDASRCILCGRCVAACNEIQVNKAIDFGYRGHSSKIIAGRDDSLMDSDCVFCGQCVEVCPVGALVEKKAIGQWRPWEIEKIRTTCPYCGVGCQQLLHVNHGKIVKVTAVADGKPNQGRLCVKGRFGYDFIYSKERLKTPLIRENGTLRSATWDEALNLVAGKFTEIIENHGPDALAGVSCARSINEDSYQMQKLFRAVLKTNNIDHCARVCHAPTVAGLATSFGSGAMTNSFNEFAKAKMFLVIGSNMTEAHPVASTFLKNAVQNGARLIVIDPRHHQLVDFAERHLPLKVGSDIALLNGIMHVLVKEELYDKEFVSSHCTGFEEFKQLLMNYPPEVAGSISGIPPETIVETARVLASVKPVMLCYTLGITEHTCGKNNVMSTANLQMLLGNMGVACGGVNPLRGQNNVQGACDMGALPNVFLGYQAVTDPKSRKIFETAWGVTNLPQNNGLMMPQMMEGLVSGSVKGLYIFGENLASSEADIHKVEHELGSAEFLVCQDIFENETTRFAHVVLPAAAWSENDGTFTNSERRVNRVRTASNPPGCAQPNWWIFKQIAKRMGHHWKSHSAQELWDDEISVLAPNLGGIKYHRIENDGLQWPCPTTTHPGTPILHTNGQFTKGKGTFAAVEWTTPAEVPDKTYPFVLSTGRRLYHYHTRTQTGRCEGLDTILGEETADLSIFDAKKMGINTDDLVKVRSRRGEVTVKARVTHEVPKGMVWMSFHFREGNSNFLTNSASDPDTMTAEFKACAVSVEPLPSA